MAVDYLINVDVDDVEKGVAFYVEVFGLRVGRRLGGAAVELLGGPAPIYVLPQAEGTLPFKGATAPRDYARHWTPVHLDFVVSDIAGALARAVKAGARHEGGIADLVWGKLAVLSDPWGHGFCLIEFKGEGYDAIADRVEPGSALLTKSPADSPKC
jgi:lactoylglutathione lyase